MPTTWICGKIGCNNRTRPRGGRIVCARCRQIERIIARPVISARAAATLERLNETSAAQLLGRKGGQARSEAKATASRANGRLGGRPRKEG